VVLEVSRMAQGTGQKMKDQRAAKTDTRNLREYDSCYSCYCYVGFEFPETPKNLLAHVHAGHDTQMIL